MKYLIVIEKTKTGYSAYSPDLDGCVAAARSRRSVVRAMQQAVEFHLDGLREEGRKTPPPRTDFDYVEVRHAGAARSATR